MCFIINWSNAHDCDVLLASAGSFLQKLSDENILRRRFEDEIITFLRNTSIGNHTCDPFELVRFNAKSFQSMASVAYDIFPVQATSVASDSSLSITENLVDLDRCLLGNEAITAYILLRSWSRFIM